MTDEGTRVPLIASWPAGIKKPGRVVDDLVEFSDFMPTICEVTGANLPSNYPGDGSSIFPVLQGNSSVRKKDWIYIWYSRTGHSDRGNVMVRNKKYSLVANNKGGDSTLTRYNGSFIGKKLKDSALSKKEIIIKEQFETIRARLSKARLLSVSNEIRTKLEK